MKSVKDRLTTLSNQAAKVHSLTLRPPHRNEGRRAPIATLA